MVRKSDLPESDMVSVSAKSSNGNSSVRTEHGTSPGDGRADSPNFGVVDRPSLVDFWFQLPSVDLRFLLNLGILAEESEVSAKK